MIATTAAMAQQIQYPKAAKDGTVDEYFGTKVADPYRWLENDTSAQTTAWVEAENRVTADFLSRIPFRQKILKRLTELANYEKIGAPRKRHGKWYFYKKMVCRTSMCSTRWTNWVVSHAYSSTPTR